MDCQESGHNPQKIISSSSIDSDAHSSQRVTTVLLNEFNYLPWSRAVTIALGGRSQLGFINGKDKAPDSSSPDFENWLAKDQMVMSWILNSMERQLAEMFSFYQSSLELWEAVKDMYGTQNNSARVFQIQQELAGLHRNGQPFVNLLSKFKGLWNELDIYRPHSIDPVVLRSRREEDQNFQLLASLGSDYEDLRSHILMNDELPSLKSVCATIQREEIRRKVMTRENPSTMAENRDFFAQKMAEQGTQKFSEKQPIPSNFKGNRSNLKCNFCNSMGHTIDRCWSLHPELKQNRHSGNHKKFVKYKANVAATEPRYSNPMSLINEFANFLQGKGNLGGEGASGEDDSALLHNSHGNAAFLSQLSNHAGNGAFLGKYGGSSTRHFSGSANREHADKFEGPSHQTEDW